MEKASKNESIYSDVIALGTVASITEDNTNMYDSLMPLV